MSSPRPGIESIDTTFHHVDDIAWTPVQRQRNADGSESAVREQWPVMHPRCLSAHVHYDPGMVVRRHGHRSEHVVVVLDGSAWINGDWCTAGTHVHVPLGATFGPIVAGTEGVTCWELSFGEFGGWGDEPESYEREIAARGVTPLPNPPLDLGSWFRDPRGDTGAERGTPRVPGLAEVLARYDDLPWVELRRQRGAGDRVAVVRAQWAIARPDFTSALVEHDPSMVTRRERWLGTHMVWVLDGGAWFDGRWCPAGTHVEVPAGCELGPIVAGSEGARFIELTHGDVRSLGVGRDAYEQALAEQGATPLPYPAFDLGPGIDDTRDAWVDDHQRTSP